MRALFVVLALVVIGFSSQSAVGQDVVWSSSFFRDDRDSSGSALTGSWEFQLGYFTTGFSPTAVNTAQWSANWESVDVTSYNEGNGTFVATYANDGSATNQKGFIWGLNRQAASNEWILISDGSWNFPGFGGLGVPVRWTVSNADNVIVGSVDSNNNMQTASVAGQPPTIDYTTWQFARFTDAEIASGSAAEDADGDGDGSSNSVEFALGSDPRSGVSLPDLSIGFGPDGRQQITVQLARQVQATIIAEVSGNLIDWSFGTPNVTEISLSPTELIFRDNVSADRRFARVRVEIP